MNPPLSRWKGGTHKQKNKNGVRNGPVTSQDHVKQGRTTSMMQADRANSEPDFQ